MGIISNTLISKSVQKRLVMQKDNREILKAVWGCDPGNKDPFGEETMREEREVEMRTTKFDEIVKLKEELRNTKERLDMAESIIEGNDRRHDEDMGYIEHYRQEITELKKLLKDNNIEIPW